jgi:UDP-N-acetylmuramoylalanine--D-glutamate ligase
MTDVQGKRVLVVGLARTGIAAAKVLTRRGAAVTVSDARPPWELRADMSDLLKHKIGVELGLHREETFLEQDLIIVSPGVLPDMPQLQAARARNIPVVSEVEAASWFLESPIIGITGSNGKTTTTSLLGEVLEASAFPTFVGGNIGVPLISAVGDVPKDAWVVTELSSFQLEATQTFRPYVAVMLNITPNHLDRHPSLEAYAQAKARIFANQTREDFAILNADDPAVMNLVPSIAARKIFFSRRRELPDGLFVDDGHVVYRVGNLERVLMTTREIQLRGDFNVENVLAAAAAACVLGADFEAIRRGVSAFRGVEHRLEFVREIRGVQFYNDSKATSVDAAAKALSAFTSGVHLILGGKDKGAPYAPIRRLLEGRVRAVYLIGAAASRIEKQLAGSVALIHAGDLETAVAEAFSRAVAGDVVLLSPACASFDQFQDYEHRGRVFKEIVGRLAEGGERRGFGTRESGVGGRESVSAAETSPREAVETRETDAGEAPHPDPEAVPDADEVATPVETEAPATVAAAAECGAASAKSLETGDGQESSMEKDPALAAPGVHESVSSPESQAPSADSVLPAPDSRITIPERIYVYEVSAEEIEYPEADFVFTRDASDSDAGSVEPLSAPEAIEDAPLPFEVRAKRAAAMTAVTEDPEARSADTSGNGSGAQPPGGQDRLPGL